ncbi:adenylate/guanylate cyclase domain-containing protein [uncultured Muriicola sp.]|uniref:adenylate/guanylate cyclase domain-containing protein n=1 Tax=uncultured Muriicola sp. TaxID=1583102 RepID=UPI0026362F1F|nr:adenylate/guanylate cyclase domain-containing protein [uncultured Muriicola sp.]
MAKILVVDDEKDLEVLIKQKFRKQIRQNEYEFVFAINGVDALEKLIAHPNMDLVLSDINMPEMDGLTLLTKLSELNPLLKSVMVSAYGDMANIRTAMNRGAFDFITKPINFEDLTMLNFMGSKEYESTVMANENVTATVMFIDVCGFTSLSETTSPDVVVSMLNSYFDTMVQEIIAQEGYIDKFMGDAIMAVFRGDYHLDRALDTALAIRQQISRLPELKEMGGYRPRVSIGINSGEMVSGNIGSSSLKRLDFTVIGDTVNIAARLENAAAENQILISEACYEQVKEAFQCKKIGDIQLKNKKEVITVYEVLE